MSVFTIYGFPQSTCVRTARMTCIEKGVDYDLEIVGFSSERLRDLHPFGRIPAARNGDVALYETSSICRYVDAAFDGPPLIPSDPAGAALAERWISVVNAYVDPPIIREIVVERVVKKLRGLEIDEARCAAAVPRAADALTVIEAQLAATPCLAGDDVSVADLFLYPIVFYLGRMPEGDELLPRFPALADWSDRIGARRSAAETVPPPPTAPAT